MQSANSSRSRHQQSQIAAQVTIRARRAAAQFGRQQSAEAEQPGLQGQRRIRARRPARARFGEALHRPDVVLVAERAEQTFPQRLFPADVPGAGAKWPPPWFATGRAPPRATVPSAAASGSSRNGAAHWPRNFSGSMRSEVVFEPRAQFARAARPAPSRSGRVGGATHRAVGVPDDVEHDIVERRIAVVAMRAPAARPQVHLHVAEHGGGVAELQDRAAKIRPALDAGKTGVKHAHGFARPRFAVDRGANADAARWPGAAVPAAGPARPATPAARPWRVRQAA